jgi:hypothetical protein
MNFINRYLWNSFSSFPATSPSSTNSSPCSRPFLTSSYATCSQESPQQSRLRSVSHEKADRILSQLYPSSRGVHPSSVLKTSFDQISLDEMDETMVSASNSNNKGEISVLTQDSSLTIDLSLVHKSKPQNPSVEDNMEMHDNADLNIDFFCKLQQQQKKSPSSVPADDNAALVTKNLHNTNSVLINRNEFDILLRKKLVKEQKKVVAASVFSSFSSASTRSDAFTKTNQWINSSNSQDNRTNSNASDISDTTEDLMKEDHSVDQIIDFSSPEMRVVIFICPEGVNRIPFQNDHVDSHNYDTNMKIFSKTARLSSLYQKYSASASSFLSFSSSTSIPAVPTPTAPSVTVRKAYGKLVPVSATVVKPSSEYGLKRQYSHDDCNSVSFINNSSISCENSPDQNCRLISSECSPTPTNSPNFSAKYSKIQ